MATKKVYQGSTGPFLFNDVSTFSNGQTHQGLISETGITVTATADPTGDELINETYLAKVIKRVTVANINNPSAELNLLDAENGTLLIVSQVGAGDNSQALYIGDETSSAGESVPDTVDGVGTSMWIKVQTASTSTDTVAYTVSGKVGGPTWDTASGNGAGRIYRDLSGNGDWNDNTWYANYVSATQKFDSIVLSKFLLGGQPGVNATSSYEIVSVQVTACADGSSVLPATADPSMRIYIWKMPSIHNFPLNVSAPNNSSASKQDIMFTNVGATSGVTINYTFDGATHFPNAYQITSGYTWGIGVSKLQDTVSSAINTFEPAFSITINYKEI